MTQDAAKDKKGERSSGKNRGFRVSERNSAKNPQRATSAAEGQRKSAKPQAPDPSKLKKLLDLISSNKEYRVDELKALLEDQVWIKKLIEAFEKRDAALEDQLELERNRAAKLKEEAQDFKRNILAKLKDVTPLLEGVTKLDFSRRLKELPSDDVFAQLYAGLNLMIEDLSAMFDESERRSERLKESEDRYRTLQANIPVGIFRSTPGGNILSANPALVKMLGYSSEKDLLRIPVINLYADPDRRRVFVKQLESKGSVTEFEAELLGRDGSKIWVWISATAVKGESGEVHYDGIIEDISKRKLAEEELKRRTDELQEREELYRALVTTAQEAILLGDPNDTILYANPSASEMLGYSEEELVGRPLFDFIPSEEKELLRSQTAQRKKGETSRYELTLIGKDGEPHQVLVTASPLFDTKGKFYASMGVFTDISDRKKAEEALRESEERFRSIYENVLIGVYRTTTDGRILMANPALVRMLGYSSFEDLVEINLEDEGNYGVDYKRSEFKERIEREGKIVGLETTLKRKDGTSVIVRENARVVRDEAGNSLYYEGTMEDITELSVLNEISRAISSTLDVNEIYGLIHEQLRRLINADNFYIALYEKGLDEVSFPYAFEEGELKQWMPRRFGKGMTEYVIRTGKPQLFQGDNKEEAAKRGVELIGKPSYSWLGVPMVIRGEVIGVMTVQSYDPEVIYSEKHMGLMQTVANQAAQAVENARAYHEMEEQLTARSVTNEISRAISSTLDINEIYGVIHEQIRRLINADNFYIALYNRELDQVDFVYAFQDGELQKWGSRRAGKGMTEYVIRTGQSQLFQEDSEEEAARRGVEHIGKRSCSWLGVPMIIRDEVIGVMTVQSFDPDIMYSERHIGLIQTVANQAAQAVQNARSYSELNRRSEELRALFDTSTQLASTLDEQEVANIIATSAKDLIPSDGCTFYKFDEASEKLAPLATTVIEGKQQQMDYNVPLGEGVTGQAAAERRPILANHVHRDPKAPRGPGTKEEPTCLLSVPLITRGELLGGITLIRMSEDEFEEHDLQLFTLFARQAASAFANSRFLSRLRELNKSLEKRSEELGALFNTSTELSSVLEEEEVASLIAQRATSLIPSNGCTFYRLDSSSEKLVPITTTVMREYKQRMAYHVPLGEGITGKTATTRRPILANHVHLDPKAPRVPGTEDVPTCLLSAPLVARGELLGAMTLVRMSEDEFTEHDLQLFTLFARQAAEAFANSRLFSQLRELNETLELKVTERTAELEQARTRLEEIHSEYKERVRARLAAIAPVMEKVSLGDFAENIPLHEEEDEFTELFVGLNLMIDDLRFMFEENRRRSEELRELNEDLKRRSAELGELLKASAAVASTLDEEEVSTLIASRATDFIGATRCTVFRFEAETNELIPQTTTSVEDKDKILTYNVPVGEGITGRAASERKPIRANNVHKDPKAPRIPGTRERPTCLLSTPLLSKGELLGVMTLTRLSEEEFTEHDLELFTLFARQVADASANSRLLSRLKELNENLEQIVAQRTAELKESSRKTADFARELEEVIYVTSHDLKTPLRAISGFSQFLYEDYREKLDAEGKLYLTRLIDSVKRMEKLLDDVLQVTAVTRTEKAFEDIQAGDLIKEAIKMVEVDEASDIIYDPDELPSVLCDRVKMVEVFYNLISNGLRFNDKPRKQVKITAQSSGGFHEFMVADNGIGIEKRHYERIFQIFQRLHQREAYEGTGVGLSMVKRVIEEHNGRVWVESQVGVGTIFHFTLPVHQDEDDGAARSERSSDG